MSTSAKLDQITDFPSLIHYLRDELEWEIPEDAVFNQLTFSWTPSEVGLELNEPIEITQLRPLRADQPWGIFFLNFPHAKLPVTVMRRILRGLSKRQRASASAGDKAAWDKDDLLFISAVGEADDRRLSFAHFQDRGKDLPALRVIGWDHDDTVRRLSHVDQLLHEKLAWPDRGVLAEAWRDQWRSAFTERPRESVRTAKAMAEALAALARDIRDRIRLILPKEKPNGDLRKLFEAVKQTLSNDLDTDKFADTYAQTIAYGLLSARINQVRERDAKHKQTQQAQLGPKPPLPQITADAAGKAMPTTNPFLRELFGSFLSAGGRDAEGSGLDFDELGVGEVVDLLNAADMEAVLLDFDKQKAGDDPVIHFYEGFLHAYDKALKVQRGVFYTPGPVVSFIVRSVDEVLRTEFGLEDGLADTATWAQFITKHPEAKIPAGVNGDEPFVKILDPATGTGTFLVEVIELIHGRLVAKWKKAGLNDMARLEAWNAWVPQHLLPRLYGFELMMAPYAVAHMKIGLKLADTGYDFRGEEMGTDGMRRSARARVFLTNALEEPRLYSLPMNWSAALAHEVEQANAVKSEEVFTIVIGNPPYSGVSGNMFPDARKLVEKYRYVDNIPIREKGALQFEKNINDDYVKFFAYAQKRLSHGMGVLGMITNNGYLDTITLRGMRSCLFSQFQRMTFTDLHGDADKRERADDGTPDENVFEIKRGVAIALLRANPAITSMLSRADLKGSFEHKTSVLSRGQFELNLSAINPAKENYFFRTGGTDAQSSFDSFPSLFSTTLVSSTGLESGRDDILTAFTTSDLISTLSRFVDAPDADFRREFDVAKAWGAHLAERRPGLRALLRDGLPAESFLFSPFDVRYVLLVKQLLKTNSLSAGQHLLSGKNVCLMVMRQVSTESGFSHVFISDSIPNNRSFYSTKGKCAYFPIWFEGGANGVNMPNFPEAELKLGIVGNHFIGHREVPLWLSYVYAVLHSRSYRKRYAHQITSDFPRVPATSNKELVTKLTALGSKLIALHLLDAESVPKLKDPAVRFVNANDREPRLGAWGQTKDVRRDPGSGRVYLNGGSWFQTVPPGAWDHWVGGYQPAQKWLKDRSQTGSGANLKPGRVLSDEDLLHYCRMIVALDETAKIMSEVDEVIDRYGGWPTAFPALGDSV